MLELIVIKLVKWFKGSGRDKTFRVVRFSLICNIQVMAIRVVEFPSRRYKTRKLLPKA